jgi:hypothetical protein
MGGFPPRRTLLDGGTAWSTGIEAMCSRQRINDAAKSRALGLIQIAQTTIPCTRSSAAGP